jgi:hypothetical protein
MVAAKSKTNRAETRLEGLAEVDSFMARLRHPHKPAIEAIRQIVRGADPVIAEGIKWNAPSFRTTEYFATTHLRAKDGVAIILHLGARVRDTGGVTIDDPDGLLNWLAKDRAMVALAGVDDAWNRQSALQHVVRQWIRHL